MPPPASGAATGPTQRGAGTGTHTIRKGDTLGSIADSELSADGRKAAPAPETRPRLEGPNLVVPLVEFSGFPQPIRLRPSPVRLLLHGASLVEAQGYNKRQYPALDR